MKIELYNVNPDDNTRRELEISIRDGKAYVCLRSQRPPSRARAGKVSEIDMWVGVSEMKRFTLDTGNAIWGFLDKRLYGRPGED